MRICPTYLRFPVIDDFDVMQNFDIIFIYPLLKQQRTREKDNDSLKFCLIHIDRCSLTLDDIKTCFGYNI